MTDNTYIRFDGRLREDHTFDHIPGWETATQLERGVGDDGPYRVELHSTDGDVLVSRSFSVEFDLACAPGGFDEMRSGRITVYLPRHPDTRRLVFRHDDHIIFERPVAEHRPSIDLTGIESDRETVSLEWTASASGDSELTYNVGALIDGVLVPLATGLVVDTYTVSVDRLPGGESAAFVVLATDGLRSRSVVSEPIEVPRTPPRVWIQSPLDGSEHPADQPVSLAGQAVDGFGGSLSAEGLRWLVDGEEIAAGARTALAASLDAGTHEVTLSYHSEEAEPVSASVTVTVSPRTEAQTEHRRLMAEIGELE